MNFIAFFIRLLLPVLILAGSVCQGSDLAFRQYKVSDGLASSTVYSGMQDMDGYIWFATESGVNRFNGRSFEHFTTDDGLADNDILRIFQDSQGRIWFLSFNGRFSYYFKGKFFNESNTPFLKAAFCGQTFIEANEDSLHRIWFNGNGNHLVMITGEKVKLIKLPEKFFYNGGVNILLKKNGLPEFVTGAEIYVYDQATGTLKFKKASNVSLQIQHPTFSESGYNFEVGYEGVVKFDEKGERLLLKRPKDVGDFFLNTIYHEKNDQVWVGTLGSGVMLYRYEHDSLRLIRNCLSQSYISDIFKDHEGNIWFTTKDEGVYMLPFFGSEVTVYRKSRDIPSENFYAVHYDRKGTLWFGGDREVIVSIDASGRLTSYKLARSGRYDFRVLDIIEDNDGNIWIATNEYTYKIGLNGVVQVILATNRAFDGPKAGKDLSVNEKGEVFLAFYAGVVKYNKSLNSFDLLPHLEYPKRVYEICALNDRMYISDINGLIELKDGKVNSLYKRDPRLSARISGIVCVNDSFLIVSTHGSGVFLLKNGIVVHSLSLSNGLPSNECHQLFEENGNVWIATKQGLVKTHLRPDGKLIVITEYNSGNLLSGGDVRDVFVRDGIVYAATSTGINVFNDRIRINTIVYPPLHVKSILVNNASVGIDTVLDLKYDENNIQLHFEAISFKSPDDVVLQYIFDENRGNWKSALGSQLIFNKLQPGEHNLKMRAKISGSSWGPIQSLRITIQEPFWQTWWFKTLLVILTSLVIVTPFMFFQYHQHKLNEALFQKQTAVFLERQRIAQDLHDDLGSAITSIYMSSEIMESKINRKQDFKKELGDIRKFALDSNEKMSEIIWAVSMSKDNLLSLVSYLNEFISDFSERTSIPVQRMIMDDVPDVVLRPQPRKNLFLCVKEAFHNIQKHSEATAAEFRMNVQDNILTIVVSDNGMGIDRQKVRESSLGLTGMEKRMHDIQGSMKVESEPGKGTKVTFVCRLLTEEVNI